MNNSISSSFYDMRSFPEFVTNLAAESAKMYNTRQSYTGQGGYNMKFYNYYQQTAPYVSQMYGNCYPKQRYMPYPNRNNGGVGVGPSNGSASISINQSTHCPLQQQQQQQHLQPSSGNTSSYCQQATNKSLNSSLNSSNYSDSGRNSTFYSSNNSGCSSPHHSSYSTDSAGTASTGALGGSANISGTAGSGSSSSASVSPKMPAPATQSQGLPQSQPGTTESAEPEQKEMVVLQISNLDASIDEHKMHQFLLCQLKPITPVISLTIESPSLAKVKVPSAQCAKQVVANLHRKKVGHKRMVVSYIKDPSSAESSALRCQVAGLLKDVPFYSLPINRFRELFQSRFKSSISVLDLYRMQDVCTITLDKNDEKYIALQPDLIDTLKNSSLVESSQHSVPYCMYHFQQEKEKGWAEQEIEPLPSVMMSITQLQSLVYSLLKSHKNDIPVASVLYCIEHELQIKIIPNENGVPLEHLLCCIRGVQIANNSYGIKVLSWMDHEQNSTKDNDDAWAVNLRYMPKSPSNEFLQQISREVVELIKMSPKSTMKFTRFIPAYHNHFGKQCRVADYGYTRLIELFEALSPVVQVMGDGENRHITLTHRTQIRRFTNDLLKILRSRANKSILLSQLPMVFSQAQNRLFDVTDYGVCDIFDIVDGLVYSNSITTKVYNDNDVLISIVKRKQTTLELEKTCTFAGEVVELFRKSPQFSILFKKFVRSYHYHFGYQCRLSDYGLLKLADLLEAISGIVETEQSNDEDRKIYLNYQVALRIFAEQVQEIIKHCTGNPKSVVRLSEILNFHKNKFGYQLQPSCFGCSNMYDAMKALPFTEVLESNGEYMVISHLEDPIFRMQTYAACAILIESQKDRLSVVELVRAYELRFKDFLTETHIFNMKHALQMEMDKGLQTVTLTPLMKFVLRMVQVVKHRTPINVHDLKLALNVSVGTCFEFGFPSVSSVLNYFADVFVSTNSSYIHERSDIELNRDCILSKVCFTSEERSSLGCSTLGSPNTAPIVKYSPLDAPRCRPPTTFASSGLVDKKPAARPLCLSQQGPSPTLGFNGPFKQMQPQLLQQPQQQQQQQQQVPLQMQRQTHPGFQPMQPLQPSQQLNHLSQPPMNPYFANNTNRPLNASISNGYGGSGNVTNTAALLANSSMLSSLLGAAPLMGMSSSMAEFNRGKENIYPPATGSSGGQSNCRSKTAAEQMANAFQSQCTLRSIGNGDTLQQPTMPLQAQGQGTGSQQMSGNRSALLQSWKSTNSLINHSSTADPILTLLSKYSEPPKPDTPPGMNLPCWLDPTWNDTESLIGRSLYSDSEVTLNIPIPELKTCSNLPPLDTPHILLSEKLSCFTFDQDK